MDLDFSRARLPLFQHQKEDAEWLLSHPCAFIASEMRTGKSAIVITAMQFLYELGKIQKVIIVTPAPVRDVWADPVIGELKKHLWLSTPARVVHFHSRTREWTQGPPAERPLEIYVTNYEFIRDKDRLDELLDLPADHQTLLVLDECFPPGTKIDTPQGKRNIEDVKPGDDVYNASGVDTVVKTARRKVNHGIRLTIDGQTIISSPNHLFFTDHGWIAAQHLKPGDRLTTTNLAMRMVRSDVRSPMAEYRNTRWQSNAQTEILRHILCSELEDESTGDQSQNPYEGKSHQPSSIFEELVGVGILRSRSQSPSMAAAWSAQNSRNISEDFSDAACDGARTNRRDTRRQWETSDQAGIDIARSPRPELDLQLRDISWSAEGRIPHLLQGRRWKSTVENRYRSRREISQPYNRSEERRNANFVRVDCVEILESRHPDLEGFRDADGSLYFYDLSIARHPSFSVNGLLVHNSSFVKNHAAHQTRACMKLRLRCGRVILLNGTPIFHSPMDLFSQGNLVHPKILDCPHVTQYRARYAIQEPVLGHGGRPVTKIVGKGKFTKEIIVQRTVGWSNLDDLERRFAPYTIRRLQKDCLDLPPKLDPVVLTATLTPATWKAYRQMRDDLVVWLTKTKVVTSATAAIKVLRLAQITSGFVSGVEDARVDEMDVAAVNELLAALDFTGAPYDRGRVSPDTDRIPVDESAPRNTDRPTQGRQSSASAVEQATLGNLPSTTVALGREKLDVLLWKLGELLVADPNLHVVVWCKYRPELQRIVDEVKATYPQFTMGVVWGNQREKERLDALALLKPETSPPGPVCVVGIEGTGSFGLDMTAAHTCVTMSSGYSPGRTAQTLDRVYGPGQTQPIAYYEIVATGPKGQRTIDHDILLARRQAEDIATRTAAAWVKALKD